MRPRSLLWLALLAFLCVAGWRLYSRAPQAEATSTQASSPATPQGPPARPPLAVQIHRPVFQPLAEELLLTGELRADELVELRGEASGRVTAIHFREGASVGRGQLLLELDDSELQAERRRSEIQADLARQREQRLSTLLTDGTVSQEVYDRAANEVAVFEAEQQLIDARIAQTEVRAPFSGMLGLRAVSLGAYLTPAQVIATLQRIDPLKIDFAVPERYVGRVQPGDELAFSASGLSGSFTGKVFAVEPRIDEQTRTFPVRARAANPEGRLLPGAFVEIRLALEEARDTLLVPSIALVPGLGKPQVLVLEDGVARSRDVVAGRRTEDRVEIIEGLTIDDAVIVSGLEQLRPGDPAREAGS